MEQSKDYLRGYADGVADSHDDDILHQSLANRLRMLATNTLLLCMSISIVILFVALVVHIMNEIL